ncbi:hypothetical protein [Roseiterribacter gracilis]
MNDDEELSRLYRKIATERAPMRLDIVRMRGHPPGARVSSRALVVAGLVVLVALIAARPLWTSPRGATPPDEVRAWLLEASIQPSQPTLK